MNFIGLSMRVDVFKDREETRDAIDQRLISFLSLCDLIPVLLPNDLPTVKHLVRQLPLRGVIFSGGNTLPIIDASDGVERYKVETWVFRWFVEKKLPIFGICHGMQIIQDIYGVTLKSIEGHVGCFHMIKSVWGDQWVNSYHNYGTQKTSPDLRVLARSEDQVVEAISDDKKKILAIMWHPERETPFQKRDIKIVKEHFSV